MKKLFLSSIKFKSGIKINKINKRYIANKEANKIYSKIVGDLPILIKNTEKFGRGIFAKRDFKKTDTIHTEIPPVVVPSFSRRNKVCRSCLSDLKKVHAVKGTIGCKFCGTEWCEECYDSANEEYHYLLCPNEKQLGELKKSCKEQNRIFPLIAIQLISKIMMEAFQTGKFTLWEKLQTLSIAKPNFIPIEWRNDYQQIAQSLLHNSDNINFFSYEWYERVMKMCYLNCINISYYPINSSEENEMKKSKGILPKTENKIENLNVENEKSDDDDFYKENNETNKKGKEKQENENENEIKIEGTGLFPICSFYNHSCEPNACIYFFNNSNAFVIAQKEIKEGEQITINYVDVEIPFLQRKQFLLQSYGFDCSCPKCLQQTKQQTKQETI